MAIAFKGFDGQLKIGEWAQIARMLQGADCTVNGFTDWYCTAGSGDRTVNVAAGSGQMAGVSIRSDQTYSVQFDIATTTRYDLVAWRLDWSVVGGDVQLVVVKGGGSATMPTLPNNGAAPADGQVGYGYGYIPLSLWRVDPGVQLPTQVMDLRLFVSAPLASATQQGIQNPRPFQPLRLADGTNWLWDPTAGQWAKQYNQKLWWAAHFTSMSGVSLQNKYAYPDLTPTTDYGAITLPVTQSGRFYFGPGTYTVNMYMPNQLNMCFGMVHMGPSEGIVQTTTAAMTQEVARIPNGASAMVNVPSQTSLVFGWYFPTSGAVYNGGSYIKVRKEGDL